ncbi:MAG: hypothetical protein IPP64_17165 [Bacteroidetes bacterium]|nr:hypothetical protein [Bacteroidota bacterium]
MTAVAGILNKQGVAIAADSAVTVNGVNHRKVYNSANKIFTLSKYHPVGIAIYNSAQIMGIPWEILIKEYRKQIGDKSFPKLSDYKDNFLSWLEANNYFIEKQNNTYIFVDFLSFVQAIINEPQFQSELRKGADIETLLSDKLNNFSLEIIKSPSIDSLKGINEPDTKKLIASLVPEILGALSNNFNRNFDQSKLEKPLLESYFNFLNHDWFIQYTGLIFTGYGETEIFPRLITINVSLVIDGKLRFIEDKKKEVVISDANNASIRPFAQTDVIDTVLQGISPELKGLSTNVFGDFINQFIHEITQIPSIPAELLVSLQAINTQQYVQNYHQQLGNIVSKRYVKPLMGAVAQLSKEDLKNIFKFVS